MDKSKMSEPNWVNRTLFHGDNLPFLRAMNSESVDLIATDPPFNKGRDFHATPDSLASGAKFQDRWSWERDVHQAWADQITDDYPKLMEAIESARYAHSDGMGAFMCFMAVRLLEMHRILKPAGSIYLHFDPTAGHYIKAVMDAIFGWKQFRNEIVWCYGAGGSSKRDFPRKHDLILRYSKTSKWTFNYQDKSLRIPYSQSTLDMHYKNTDKDGRRYRVQKGKYKTYADEGKLMPDYWTDIGGQYATSPIMKESTGFPTQKPLALYERVIKASSNEGDMVLDPFAGCATTCVAAERLKRQWIGIDIWDKAHEVVIKRLRDEKLLTPEGDHGGELFTVGQITYSTESPERTDDGGEAAPFLRVKECVREPRGRRMTRAEMYEFLITQHGPRCQGCDRTFDDPRYLQLDHNTPRSDGGLNHISNRVLLCGPCNRAKSNIYTLSGLRRENAKHGWMAK